MKNLIKSAIALSVVSAMSSSFAEEAVSYTISEYSGLDNIKNTYAIEQTNIGQTLIVGQTSYNFPVQFDYLDEDDFDRIVRLAERDHEAVFELYEIDEQAEEQLRAGNPDANALSWTIRYLRTAGGSENQRIGDTFVYRYDENSKQAFELPVFDSAFPETGQLTRSTVDSAQGMTDDGWVFGFSSAPYLPLEPFDDDGEEEIHWYREFDQRGWISFDGETVIELPPAEAKYGGLSAIYDVNSNRVAVGTSSVALSSRTLDDIEKEDDYCLTDNLINDIPLEICIQNRRRQLYYSNAFLWEMNEQGEIVNTVDLGTGIVNPNEEDERAFVSAATAINDDGVIVGFSDFWWDEDETEPSKTERKGQFAAVFKDGEVIQFTDRDEYFESRALDINNAGMFTGYMYAYINGKPRTKFFYADANSDVITPVFPEDFFKGSASYPHAINDNNIIVGEGEVEDFVDSSEFPRRRHGFLYDIGNAQFYNVNQFLSCEDQAKYVIVEAKDINERNEILATAWVRKPKLDSQGQPFSIDGEIVEGAEEDVLRVVVLKPTGSTFSVNDCREDLGETIERQGASMSWSLWLLALFGFGARQLRTKNL
ncbi:DUF3466 family protein [Thalassotalea ponticola]|uniref:DUF3466 family protein n=1 Tax=Thalassotalea ponticola TaxID=1523392 RepID=UPI0025B36A9F|nr:DUF3466 family protein [Thalassotalea ponticola]MDN3653097.1 DUF3466 family protein [Thalassotalea ponticola]